MPRTRRWSDALDHCVKRWTPMTFLTDIFTTIARISLILVLVISAVAQGRRTENAGACRQRVDAQITRKEFEAVMTKIAAGWNTNNAKSAASCFTEDAIYSSAPSQKLRRGRTELYQWFGGDNGRPKSMRMQWHHLIFDPDQQIGAGEYTFEYETRTHGLVIVKIRDGMVANWREYEHNSTLSWDAMVGDNRF
jgi:hypothetical protein